MGLGLVGGFFVLELLGALWAESVVLQADAAHLLMDVMALGVSLLAMRLAVRRTTTAGIVFEGVEALGGHASPRAGIMLVVALMALVVNGLSAWLLQDAIGHAHPHAHDADNPDDHGHAEAEDHAGHDHSGHDHVGHEHHDHASPRTGKTQG